MRPLNRILEGCQNVKKARFRLPVSKMRGGALFLERVGRLYKNMEGNAPADLKPGAYKLGGLVPPRER
jgi:hypothetical protein